MKPLPVPDDPRRHEVQDPSAPVGRVLVSGTSSGLGRALHGVFGGDVVRRHALDEDLPRWIAGGTDVLIHCAADARKEFPATELAAYRESHLTLTERLLHVPHRLFVYVSSQAVYPADGHAWREDEDVRVSDALSVYGIFKLLAEDSVRRMSPRALILRTSALVGPEGRANNIMRLLRREPGRLFLSGACPYNLIAYSQVAAFVREAFRHGTAGTFNIGARDDRTLAEIARHVGADVTFGDHLYTAPAADLSKSRSVTRVFDLTTLEVAELVARQIDEARATRGS
jgi:nucleoside-diphosphate-sugar epimerase